jgi:alkylation response protein AidB-like acyl-CoA dehydrogenase
MTFTPITLRRPAVLPGEAALRAEVRAFLAAEAFEPRCDSWLAGHDAAFSRRLAAAGFVGMTIPKEWGGHGRSALERYVVTEELLAAGAPVAAHWVADRQTAPLLAKFGTDEQRARFLPAIARGECFFSIGMSEPESGSDLASIRTRAEKVDGGWQVDGTKVWTSHAHHSHFMLTLCRTEPAGESRHEGLSQLIVDLHAPGVDVRPIALLNGERHFNEVFLDAVHVPDAMVAGTLGNGWAQVMSELAYERSGPERLMSTYPLLAELVRCAGPEPDRSDAVALGRLVGHLVALRRLSRSVAAAIDAGGSPATEASLVKELGTRLERTITEVARRQVAAEPREHGGTRFEQLLAQAIVAGPGFTLRAGTTEILRGIVALGLGVR